MKYYLQKFYYIWRKIGLYNLFSPLLKKILYRKKKYWLEKNILLEKYKTIYFPVSKTASTSIKVCITSLLWLENPNNLVHRTNFDYVKRKEINSKYKDYFRFAFVRNPYDRVVSSYKNRILKEVITKRPYIKWVHWNYLSLGNFYVWMSFKNYVKEICKIDDKIADNHFRTQYWILSNEKQELLPNHIYKFENLSFEFEKIQEKMWVKNKIKLPHLMKSKHKPYRDYYDEETKTLVKERFKKDLEVFWYEF